MVLAFAALNESPERGIQQEDAAGTESLEAQEVRVYSTYEDALRFIQNGETSQAQDLLEGLLDDPILKVPTEAANGQRQSRGTALGAQLRFLVLKNLAALLAARDEDAPRALDLYAQALSLDQEDIVVWNRMGTLAAELGMWGLSRAVFERGLACNARHPLLLEKLMEVVLHIGDWDAAAHLAARLLHQDAFHPRARVLSAFFAQQGVGNLPNLFTARNGVPGLPFSTTEVIGAEACLEDAWRPQFPLRAIPTRVPGTPAPDPSSLMIGAPTWKALAQALLARLVQTLDAAPEGRFPAVGQAVQIVVNDPPLAPVSASLGPSKGLQEMHTICDMAQPLGESRSRAGGTGTADSARPVEAETGRAGQVGGAEGEEPSNQPEGPGRSSGREASSPGAQPMEGVEGPEILGTAAAATSDPRPKAEVENSKPGGAGKGLAPASELMFRGTPFQETELLDILRQMAEALQHLHGRGIIHMDVKPDNIYRCHDGSVKLGDFGLATTRAGRASITATEGDARYLAPELLKDNLEHLEKADIFALGASLYELALGTTLPTGGPGYEDMRNAKLKLLPGYTTQFQTMLKALLAPRAVDRPTAKKILTSSLLAKRPTSTYAELPFLKSSHQ